MNKTIFEKIIDKEIPSDIIYEDDLLIAIKDINPVAPVHLLIIPKKVIPTLNDLSEEDSIIVGKMVSLAKDLAKKLNIDKQVIELFSIVMMMVDKLFIIYIYT